MPVAVDVLHREDVHAGRADLLLFLLVEVADADEHRVLRQDGRRRPIAASSRGSCPSSAASGMPCTLPAGRRLAACSCRRARRPRSGRAVSTSCAAPSRRLPRPSRPRGCDRRRAPAATRPPRATARQTWYSVWQTLAIVADVFLLARRPGACVSGIGVGRSPLSTTVRPSARIDRRGRRCGRPTAPCRRRAAPPPRSSGTPMMWTGFNSNSQFALQFGSTRHMPAWALRVGSWTLSSSCTTPTCPRPRRHDRREERRMRETVFRNGSISFFLLTTLCATNRPPALAAGRPCRRTSCSRASRRRGTRGRSARAASGSP